MLHQYNPYVQRFKQTLNMIQDHEIMDYELNIHTNGNIDHRRYNKPTGHGQEEIAAFIPGNENDNDFTDKRSIRVRFRGGPLWNISDCHKSYDGLHYVLFHPLGQDGWSPGSIPLLPLPHQYRRSHQNEVSSHNEAIDHDAPHHENEINDEDGNEHRVSVRTHRQRRLYVTSKEYAAYFMHDS